MRKLMLAAAAMLLILTVNGGPNTAESATLGSPNAAAAAASQTLRVKLMRSGAPNMSVPKEVEHGVHLCSQDSHCGSGHKCCSGHCKAVATCG